MRKNKITAVLGPTNTGKTFLAIDRLSIENNCEMYVIGGMCDLEGFVSTDNYNFEVVIPSVNKLLHEDCDILSMYSDIVAAEQVIKNKQYALDVFDQIAKKLELPEIIYPSDVRNDLYIVINS